MARVGSALVVALVGFWIAVGIPGVGAAEAAAVVASTAAPEDTIVRVPEAEEPAVAANAASSEKTSSAALRGTPASSSEASTADSAEAAPTPAPTPEHQQGGAPEDGASPWDHMTGPFR